VGKFKHNFAKVTDHRSPDVDPLDNHVWGVVLQTLQDIKAKEQTENVLHLIPEQLPQDSINKTILSFTKRIRACVKGGLNISNML